MLTDARVSGVPSVEESLKNLNEMDKEINRIIDSIVAGEETAIHKILEEHGVIL